MSLCTGKHPATYSPHDLKLAAYCDTERLLAKTGYTVPPYFGHDRDIRDLQMLGNGPDDSVFPGFQGAGDCVWAGAAEETKLFTAEGSAEAKFTGANAISDYSIVTGYVPSTGANDNGTDVRTAMSYRRKTGIIDQAGNRHKIGAYLALEPGNLTHLYAAIYLGHAVGIGIQFPNSAMDQFNAGHSWSVVSGATIESGHYIPAVAKRPGGLTIWTWARPVLMTTRFLQAYCDEAWAILSPEMLKAGRSSEHFDYQRLAKDIAAL
jgi:hypothetical protein